MPIRQKLFYQLLHGVPSFLIVRVKCCHMIINPSLNMSRRRQKCFHQCWKYSRAGECCNREVYVEKFKMSKFFLGSKVSFSVTLTTL